MSIRIMRLFGTKDLGATLTNSISIDSLSTATNIPENCRWEDSAETNTKMLPSGLNEKVRSKPIETGLYVNPLRYLKNWVLLAQMCILRKILFLQCVCTKKPVGQYLRIERILGHFSINAEKSTDNG